jgi:hypothetical protein
MGLHVKVRRIRMRPRSSCSETEPPAEEAGLRILTPFQEGRRATVIRFLYPERSWTADERTAPKIKSQEPVRIPRDADPRALPDFAGFVITASEP